MEPDNGIVLYEWIHQEFTLERRAAFVKSLAPHLATVVQPGDRVLDLCCGAGPFSFFLEEHGAKVTAVDLAPYMIRLAREEARKRSSAVEFVQADVLAHDWGSEQFDLAVLLGNTVSDFPLERFVDLARKVGAALKRGGTFAVHYLDGLRPFVQGEYVRVGVQQEEPPRISRRFKEYRSDVAAYVEVYTNAATGVAYEYTSYLYAPPFLRLALRGVFELRRAISVGTRGSLDVFSKK